MLPLGITLAQNLGFSGAGSPQAWVGGRTAFVVQASSYGGTGIKLELQGPSGSWMTVGSSVFTADGILSFDGPAGQYRLNSNAASTAVFAVLTHIPY